VSYGRETLSLKLWAEYKLTDFKKEEDIWAQEGGDKGGVGKKLNSEELRDF
jgi:hypothetical protein